MKALELHVRADAGAENRMIDALNMIITIEYQAEITYGGTKEKMALQPFMNILECIRSIGDSPTDLVNEHRLRKFLQNRLKNATKRKETIQHKRTSTVHESVNLAVGM